MHLNHFGVLLFFFYLLFTCFFPLCFSPIWEKKPSVSAVCLTCLPPACPDTIPYRPSKCAWSNGVFCAYRMAKRTKMSGEMTQVWFRRHLSKLKYKGVGLFSQDKPSGKKNHNPMMKNPICNRKVPRFTASIPDLPQEPGPAEPSPTESAEVSVETKMAKHLQIALICFKFHWREQEWASQNA